MVDTSVQVDSDLVGGQRAGTFAFSFVASDVTQGALISNQTDFVDSTVISIGASIDSDGTGPEGTGYSGDLDPGHIFLHMSNSGPTLKSQMALAVGVEYTVVITFDRNSASIFINGVLDSTALGDFSSPENSGSVAAIGTWLGHGTEQLRPFDGTIGQTLIFDQALAPSDAATLSAGGTIGVAASYSCSDDGLGNHDIAGSARGDALFGADQDDVIWGHGGEDLIRAGRGHDVVRAGRGADDIHGGKGVDDLYGGRGADVFHFSSATDSGPGALADTVHDFELGLDLIDLSDMAGLQFIGNASFSQTAGEVRFDRSKGLVKLDLDGDGAADSTIHVLSDRALSVSDFLF